MKKRWLMGLLAGVAVGVLADKGVEWTTDLAAAKTAAGSANKRILVNFTGSDWCPWCIRLQKEVFSQADFADYAKKNLILVEIDFPRKKPQSEELKKTNQSLNQEYSIKGYPTVLVLNGQGKKIGELGYMPGGPKAFLAKLEEIKE